MPLALLWKSGNTAKSGVSGTVITLPVSAAGFCGKKKKIEVLYCF